VSEGGGDEGGRRAAHRLYALVAWPTLGGLPLVDPGGAPALERELIALCRRLGTEPLELRVSADRVVLLLRFGPGQALGDVVRRLKRGSESALRRWGRPARWGRGFAGCSVGPAQVHRLVRRMRSERSGRPAPVPGPAEGPPPVGARRPPPRQREPTRG